MSFKLKIKDQDIEIDFDEMSIDGLGETGEPAKFILEGEDKTTGDRYRIEWNVYKEPNLGEGSDIPVVQ